MVNDLLYRLPDVYFFVNADLLTGILSHVLYELASKWRVHNQNKALLRHKNARFLLDTDL